MKKRLVVVGNGMVGFKFCEKLVERGLHERFEIAVFGEESLPAYDRVHLTDIISSRTTEKLLLAEYDWYLSHGIDLNLEEPVKQIDRHRKVVRSEGRIEKPYDILVLATGSRANIPQIDGVNQEGVLAYRTFFDLESIIDWSMHAKSAAVIGGGLLGIEAAKALRDLDIEVCVIHHGHWLMGRQLDEMGGTILANEMERFGVRVYLDKRTTRIDRTGSTLLLKTADGMIIRSDMVVLATGIKPRDELAAASGLALGQNGGILINDYLQTSNPCIYAIGECANWGGRMFGTLAPIYAMAEAMVETLETGKPVAFSPPVFSIKLKPMGVNVATIGNPLVSHSDLRVFTYQTDNVYRKLVMQKNRVVGAISVGDWPEFGRVQQAAASRESIAKRLLKRFQNTGDLWPQGRSANTADWPDTTVICTCLGVTKGQLVAAYNQGAVSFEALGTATGASTVCGTCRNSVAQLAGAKVMPQTPTGYWGLLTGGALAAVAALIMLFAPPIPYAKQISAAMWKWDSLWLDNTLRQITGYTAGGLALLSMFLSLRKRARWFSRGNVGMWRAAHALIAAAALLALALHTGLRWGNSLNFALQAAFVTASVTGVIAVALFASTGTGDIAAARYRPVAILAHILALWALPVLLTFHILSVYYF